MLQAIQNWGKKRNEGMREKQCEVLAGKVGPMTGSAVFWRIITSSVEEQ